MNAHIRGLWVERRRIPSPTSHGQAYKNAMVVNNTLKSIGNTSTNTNF